MLLHRHLPVSRGSLFDQIETYDRRKDAGKLPPIQGDLRDFRLAEYHRADIGVCLDLQHRFGQQKRELPAFTQQRERLLQKQRKGFPGADVPRIASAAGGLVIGSPRWIGRDGIDAVQQAVAGTARGAGCQFRQ